jgi:hypothetical protein
MSGISLDKFQQVQHTENVSLGEDKKEVAKQERGNLFGRFVSWLSPGEARKNNEVTKAFFDSLEKTYGKEVKDWAIEGYESRLTEGKPLSGYRIQRILERAQVGQEGLTPEQAMTVKTRLFTQKAPEFLREALKDFDIPEDKRRDWERTLVRMLPEARQLTEQFDPTKYDDEFRALVGNFVETHRMALENIGGLEAKRQDLYGHDGFDWHGVPQDSVERLAFPMTGTMNYCQKFLDEFGAGDGKTSNIDDYFRESVLPGAKKSFIRSYGETAPEKMQGYDGVRQQNDKVNNGTYQLYPMAGAEFVYVQRLDCGVQLLQDEQVRGEKFHISVQPEDMAKVFEALSPILTREDGPIPMWKTIDVDDTQRTIDELSPQRNELLKAKQDDPEAFTQVQQETLDKLTRKIDMAQRLRDSCQITLYLDPNGDVGDERVSKLLGEIESTLTGLGIEPSGTPESDEPVGRFVSFRIGSVTHLPGDPGYDEAFSRSTGKGYGEPIQERFDPLGEDYEQHKVKFRDNPNYLAQVGVVVDVHMDEISRLSERLSEVGNDEDERGKLLVDMLGMGKTISELNLPEEAKRQLTGAYGDLMRREAGISDRSSDLLGQDPVGFGGFIDGIRTSTFDDDAKVQLEQLVSLTGKLMIAASNPDTPIGDRLRMAGELDSLHSQIGSLLTSQGDNVDGGGQELIRALRTVPFKPDLGDIAGMFQQHDRTDIPDDPGRVSELFGTLGVALESLDRGLPLIPEERQELDQLVEDLDNFLEFIGPRPGFEAPVNDLINEIGRLKQAILNQLGPG